MPLTKLQSGILRVIAKNRDPESFVAGAVPINRDGPRYSADIDIFHNHMERVGETARIDASALEAAGYSVAWTRQLPAIVGARVGRAGEATKIEWVADSDFRFFPAVEDADFGYVLHIADLAVNKLMAAVGRREPRDVVDLLTIHDTHLPLGAVAWAAVEVAPGFTPEGLLSELARNARHAPADYRQLDAVPPIDPADIATRLKTAIQVASEFVAAMPSGKAGRLFLENGRPVQPDPRALSKYAEHLPKRRGHWPQSTEISHAMLDRLQGKTRKKQRTKKDET